MSQTAAVLQFGTAFPGVLAVVACICRYPVEGRQFVDGQFVGHGGALIIVQRTAEACQTHVHAILPCLVLVGVEILVYNHIGLFHLGMCGALEGEVQSLENVPAQGEVAVPQIGTAPRYGQRL